MKKLLLIPLTLLIVTAFGQNNAPIAVNDTFYLNFNESLSFNQYSGAFIAANPSIYNILVNDNEPDGDSIFIDTAFYYGSGYFNINTNIIGSIYNSMVNYTPPYNYFGLDSFQYVIKDSGIPTMYDTAWVYFAVKYDYEFLDLNNIKAEISLFGLFQDYSNGIASFNVPKQNNPSDPKYTTIFAANLWMAGKNQDSVYANCETFGSQFSNPVYPYPTFVSRAGPIMDFSYYPNVYDYKWDRFWKINIQDIIYHQNNWSNAGYQAPEAIENWPAHGDVSKGQAWMLAPFYDNNNDGFYNPYDGDYPQIKGQQAVYYIYNDERALPGSASKMGTEIHCMLYAYNCPSDSAINNTIFADYTIYNRSSLTYDSTYVGFWADFDIGGASDDYVGCDVQRSTFYGYNGDNFDEDANGNYGYQNHPPAQGVTFLKGAKQDNDGLDNPLTNNIQDALDSNGMVYPALGNGFGDGIVDNEYWGMEHFMYYSIGGGQFPGDGDPATTYAHYNYLKGYWRDSTQMVWGGNGNAGSTGGTDTAKYIFPGNSDPLFYGTYGVPQSPNNWSEFTANNPSGDRRGLGSTGPFTFDPDSSVEITLAFVFGRDYVDTLAPNLASIVVMQERVDSIHSYYRNGFTTTACGNTLSLKEEKVEENALAIYPNPFTQQITINYELENEQALLNVFNAFGKLVKTVIVNQYQTVIDLSKETNGIYFVQLLDGDKVLTKKVIKQ